jgi:alkylation response protein AidB-like acyl-CoA dehydrogenase
MLLLFSAPASICWTIGGKEQEMARTSTVECDPVALAAELRPLLARNAAQTEHDRRLPQENIDALEAANLFKLMTPRRWDGYGASFVTSMSVHAELAKGCASTAWVAMIVGGSMWVASLLPDRGQEEIFTSSAGSRSSGVLSGTMKGHRVDGGLRVSGKNGFASGCWHSSWALLGFEAGAQGNPDPVIGFAPMSEIEIEDTWFVAGMCGTGSNTLVAKDLFIPDHRILPMVSALRGDYPQGRYSGEPSDRWALAPILPLLLLGPIVGNARALLEAIVDGTTKRGITYTTYGRQADAPVFQHHIAEAALKIESAWLHTMRAAKDIDETAAAGKQMDYLTRARIRGESGYAAKLVREAVDALVSVAGASSFAESNPIQRMWRDANVATRHAMLATAPDLEMYGRALLGVEGNIAPVI